jgi:hypothetical protein
MFDGGLVIKYKNSLEYARDGGIMMSRAGLGNVTNKYSSQPIILDGGDSGAIDGNLRGGAIWSQWGGSQYGIAMRGASLGDTYPYLQDPALFVTKDKVGIGTTSPVGKFDVWDGASNGSNIQQNAFFYLRNPANAATNYGAALVFENTDGAAGNRQGLGRIAALRENNAASYSSYLQFSPTLNGSEFEGMRITSGGKVGVGTNNPHCKLDVQGGGTRCSYPFGIGQTGTYATYTHTAVGGIANNAGSWTKDFVVGSYERGGWIRVYSGATMSGSAANGQVQNPKTAEFVYSIYGNSLYWNRVSGSTNISLSSGGYQTIRVTSSGGGSYNHGWVEIWQQGGVAIF